MTELEFEKLVIEFSEATENLVLEQHHGKRTAHEETAHGKAYDAIMNEPAARVEFAEALQ